jgi:hypothetical protein
MIIVLSFLVGLYYKVQNKHEKTLILKTRQKGLKDTLIQRPKLAPHTDKIVLKAQLELHYGLIRIIG